MGRRARWSKRRKVALAIARALVALVLAGLVWAQVRFGPPTARFPRFWVSKVLLGTGPTAVEITDRKTVSRLYSAASRAFYEFDYPPRCLSDSSPESCSVNFLLLSGRTFQIQLGIDGCGAIYCPSLNRSYDDRGGLIDLYRRLRFGTQGGDAQRDKGDSD